MSCSERYLEGSDDAAGGVADRLDNLPVRKPRDRCI